MKKLELIREISRKTQLTQTQASEALETTLNIIKSALSKKEEVKLVGFGSFKVATRKERTGVNPRTKEPITIPTTEVAKFVPGKELREVVNTAPKTGTSKNTTTKNPPPKNTKK
ncbi:MAG: HU family DNA-binding protein [Candidatus Riflebacteria bacterium]|nr:HU family DNA-binding protein [Candidatus Riflebacteria bacterium]